MKITFPLLLTFALISNYSYAATYSAYVPLDGILSSSKPTEPTDFPEIVLPQITQNIELEVLYGDINSGSHPYINSLSVSKLPNELVYSINAKTRLNFSLNDQYDLNGNYSPFLLNNQGCTNLGSHYNCIFKITDSSEGFDASGNRLDEIYLQSSNRFFGVISVSN